MSAYNSHKRALPSTPPLERMTKDRRRTRDQVSPRPTGAQSDLITSLGSRAHEEKFAREQTRLNQLHEAEQMREWVAKEDDFVLKQSKKKAHIRVREGRAKSIDWLAVTLGAADTTRDALDDDQDEAGTDVIDPLGVFEGLDLKQLQELGRDIETYLCLESNAQNRTYWNALKVICKDYLSRSAPTLVQGLNNTSVSADVDRLLSPKSLPQLTVLEKQISDKLQSNEPIDVEYWEELLRSVAIYKAKAELKGVYNSIIESRLNSLRQGQRAEAMDLTRKLELLLDDPDDAVDNHVPHSEDKSPYPPENRYSIIYSRDLDPEPVLKLRAEDKCFDVLEEAIFLDKFNAERRRVINLGYVPSKQTSSEKRIDTSTSKPTEAPLATTARFAPVAPEDFSSATTALYEREVARGVQEDEEIFAGEEEVTTKSKPQWANKYRPRKPRYFNRVQMGYEWNKYNQTHYDHGNPPPKVVQGYKFNIFYPDLIDKSKAPTYRIEREGGRKRGESFAPAGEEDTCLIRFISGPPYEEIAFRIIDKEWDYSAKRERGFRSSFDKVNLSSSYFS
ncbi:MAG: hypothetical protein Q9217_000054 [Psora testacea]